MTGTTEERFDPVPIPFDGVATEPSEASRDSFTGSHASWLASEASNAGPTDNETWATFGSYINQSGQRSQQNREMLGEMLHVCIYIDFDLFTYAIVCFCMYVCIY